MFTAQLSDIPTAHVEHTCTLLKDGSVLITGGCDSEGEPQATALRYHQGGWRQVAPLPSPSRRHTATALPSGELLVVGIGYERGGACLYDPVADAWYPVASPETPRVEHAAALLEDGRVLICGGREAALLEGLEPNDRRAVGPLSSVEIFDPTTSSWSEGPEMTEGRRKHGLYPLANGDLLAVGGKGLSKLGAKRRLKSNERLDNAQQQWRSVGKLEYPEQRLAPLADGRWLGQQGYIFDPSDDSWTEVEPGFRGGGAMVTLSDGRVACFGVRGDEVFDPATERWTPCGEPTRLQRRGHSVVALSDEKLLLVGGTSGRGRGLPLAQELWVDLEPDAVIPPEASLEPTGAEELMKMLIENDKLELEDDADVASLIERVDRILRFGDNAGAKASAMGRVLLDSDDVVDLYMEDRDLRKLLQQW